MEEKWKELVEWGADYEGAVKRMMGDVAFYENVLRKFYRKKEWEILREKLEEGDYRQAFLAAHDLKGVTVTLGLLPLWKSVSVVVEDMRTLPLSESKAGQLQKDYEQFFREVDAFISVMENLR